MLRGRTDAAAMKAKKELLAGLRARSKYPHVADPGHRNFGTHFVALHHAALAGLGDAASMRIVRAMILDGSDLSGVGDLAALRAVELGLDGAIDDAATRMAMDVAFTNEERSGIFEDLRVRLLDAVVEVAPEDPRWTVALIDADRDTRERALALFSRHSPWGACDAVLRVADAATDRGIDDGLLVLTTQRDGCRAAFDEVARDETRPAKVRGMAFESLAVLRARLPREVIDAATDDEGMRVHLERAATIATLIGSRKGG